ncbi:MATE family efflux transporter [Grimontia marina]|uniref:Multidrug resistance protein NorM n=1 Tax=Grimontia marina TaxID=646534 RepID=A0A128FHM5_9GAMM|nr:MATE family efflux transporter [Grimontia marina]CZF86297.1 Multidrug resistance protein NorM [Grimontia marina]
MSKFHAMRSRLLANGPLFALALPVALQTAVFSSKSVVDTVMLGGVGELEIAAVGLAAKAQMIISFFIIGLSIGGGQIAAQCFGEKGTAGKKKLHNTVLITLFLSLVTAACFFILLFIFPEALMAVGTQSSDVIVKGADYLRPIAFTLFCFAVTSSLACGLRAMHQPGIATKVSLIGVVLNLFLNWLLIFGHWGMPAMGIIGAAIGTLISAVVECLLLISYLALTKHPLASIHPAQFITLKVRDIQIVGKLSITAAINSVVWAGGLFAFHAILGYRDADLLVALSVLAPLEALAMSLLIGLATAGSILVGNKVGANQRGELAKTVRSNLLVSFAVGVCSAMVLMALKAPLVSLFFHSETPSDAQTLALSLYDIMAFSLVIKSVSMMLIVGVLRAGGDASFCLFTDIFAQWIVLLPCAFMLTYWLQWPAVYLFGLVLVEESLKMIVCLWRLKSGRWIRNLAAAMS